LWTMASTQKYQKPKELIEGAACQIVIGCGQVVRVSDLVKSVERFSVESRQADAFTNLLWQIRVIVSIVGQNVEEKCPQQNSGGFRTFFDLDLLISVRQYVQQGLRKIWRGDTLEPANSAVTVLPF
jgi:hypothetical protein